MPKEQLREAARRATVAWHASAGITKQKRKRRLGNDQKNHQNRGFSGRTLDCRWSTALDPGLAWLLPSTCSMAIAKLGVGGGDCRRRESASERHPPDEQSADPAQPPAAFNRDRIAVK
eukprot:scaffold2821_cov240-Pinguiococcus_pyrenoidosus.AAC.4